LDRPLTIDISGLPPKKAATVRVTSVDRLGGQWMSEAKFIADGHGDINPRRAASMGGSYSGVQPMGLVDSMQPTHPAADDAAYFWGGAARQFTLTVTANGRTASHVFVRYALANGVVEPPLESLSSAGFVGRFWQPENRTTRHAAVLAFGGSEGGLTGDLLGALLASHGYPALDIAYFNAPGLPSTLANIPLEYFARALRWLSEQPDVDPQHIYTLGGSRGSEAALLLGVYYPDLVHGVIASVPGDKSVCSYPACDGPAWTLNGRPLPYTHQFDAVSPTDDPNAIIPVERIQGPIFLDCGGNDGVWTSCSFGQAIIGRLDTFHDPWPHVLFSYPEAGHGVGTLVPYLASTAAAVNAPSFGGGTPNANQIARAQLWPHLLGFLATAGLTS
jgi:dienelactone hydrolase